MSERHSTADERIAGDAALALWRRYRACGDRRQRDRLVLTFAPMAGCIARRRLRGVPGHCEVEDVISCGLEALIRGVDSYDEACGATLAQFLWTRIRRGILDELRGRDPEPPLALAQWEGADQLPSAYPSSDPEHASARREAKQRFREAFRALPERDRRVAVLLYVENLTLREIGELLGVTESRVCQIHSQLRRELRVTLADDAPLLGAAA